MANVQANEITIEYELEGPDDGPVLLLLHGLGAQLTRWPRALLDGFVGAGFQVLRMDNRDVGLSSHFNDAGIPDIAAITAAMKRGETPALPYSLSDMALDCIGLLGALNIPRAHVVGVSLGGMVAQLLAIEHADHVQSLNIMMSKSGNPDMPGSDKKAMAALSTPAPDPAQDLEAYIAHQVNMNRVLQSPAYPKAEDELRSFAAEAAARAYDPSGNARQLAAATGAHDRRAELRALKVPALVIHGSDDILIPPACGKDIADNIPGSWFLEVNGMGHDLPEELFELFVSTIAANCARG